MDAFRRVDDLSVVIVNAKILRSVLTGVTSPDDRTRLAGSIDGIYASFGVATIGNSHSTRLG